MVSFNVDYLHALAAPPSPRATSKPSTALTEKQRIENSHAIKDYNYHNFIAYALYSPFYIAGPVISFNDWFAQSHHSLPSINAKRIGAYALRFGFCLLTMELVLHYMYVVSICETRAWKDDSSFQISMVALMNLNVIWLKLLLPWRLFRLWGLLDNIDAPENMVRCVNNNYSALAFWRSWHRSFNRWVTRYIYIPLGGSNRPIINSLLVFTFVAIWHDIQLRLLIWGWMVVFFVLPEVAATLVFPEKKWGQKPIFRHICAIGGVANIWMMMIANLVGFAVGVDGITQMLHDMLTTADGLKYVIFSSCCLFIGVQAMFEFRQREYRKGINLRC
jgi:D-alanyl-lipoteichoic acid acyltransferase DltB (MBOAT superfamily)